MKKVAVIPNIITAFGLSCGLFVIFTTMMHPFSERLLYTSVAFLLFAALADFADGAVARLIQAQSDFGGQFDSLSDAITFGVAPPVVALRSCVACPCDRIHHFFLLLAAMMFALCGTLRLVRYTVHHVGKKEIIKAPYFMGLPIPSAAIAVLSFTLYFFSADYVPFSSSRKAELLSLVFICLGSLMVSRWKFPSFKSLQVRVSSLSLLVGVCIIATFFLYGLQDYFIEAFFLISWLYVISSVIGNLVPHKKKL